MWRRSSRLKLKGVLSWSEEFSRRSEWLSCISQWIMKNQSKTSSNIWSYPIVCLSCQSDAARETTRPSSTWWVPAARHLWSLQFEVRWTRTPFKISGSSDSDSLNVFSTLSSREKLLFSMPPASSFLKPSNYVQDRWENWHSRKRTYGLMIIMRWSNYSVRIKWLRSSKSKASSLK